MWLLERASAGKTDNVGLFVSGSDGMLKEKAPGGNREPVLDVEVTESCLTVCIYVCIKTSAI